LIDVRDGNNGAHVTAIANQLTFGAAAGGLIPLTITDPGRDDLNSTGLIRLVNDQGRFEEISYSGLVYNANGSVTMQLADPLPAGFTAANITRVELGRTNVFKGLPHYMNKFNELVRTFARAINEGTRMNGTRIPNAYLREERDFTHILDDMANGGINGLHEMARAHWAHFAHLGFTDSNGIGTKMIADLVADGIIAAGATPTDLQALNWYRDNGFLDVFTYDHTNPSQALYSFALNPILAARPGWLAVNTNNSTGESFNDVVLKGFAAVNNFNGLFAEGKLSDFVIAMSGELGIDLQMAQRFEGNYNDIVQTVEIQRLSISGVDVNEEMLDMMRFQHIYQAAARLVNIIDGIYDTTINRLGVGF
jgi:flagellar hook-associated protein 1 FlgK